MSHRVLIVDDEGLLVRTLVQAFRERGFDIQSASTAEDAQKRFNAGDTFDLLILDNKLPGMSGLDLLEKQSSSLDRTRIILMTAFDTAETQDRCRRLGVDRYLRKPFDLSAILDLASQLVSEDENRGASPQGSNQSSKEGG
ncbi:MAG: response regulator [Candidatus Eisenbacteria bacterium]|uniref:Response regulator n=1 Tax=Eiseniibacteriota bacterium TaxID=2212470 RepID=A0A948WC04_UNCEI|nr:response regulator [Candidatus Eisenbacteria bacterium]MBU1948742.1 response regulator [Candidatus Eisenbacteria bacterium]MBU2690473.1 response regulator [Candidatus Eisenbacteria bacterium]